MTRGPVLVVGDVMVDVVARAHTPLAHASDTPAAVRFTGGGGAANVAAWLVRAGERGVLCARVGDDIAGREQVSELMWAGVETRIAVDREAATGACVVLVEPGGERTMLPDRGANLRLSPADLPAEGFAPGGHLHVSGYALLHDGPRAAAVAALERARGAGMTTSVDPASAAPLGELGAARFLELVAGAGLLLPNADEARVLTGIDEPAEAARELARRARTEVVVTAGADGAWWSDGGPAPPLHSPSVTSVPTGGTEVTLGEDSTGAGDAFAAGLIAARRGGAAPQDALAAAAALAAEAVGRSGGRPAAPALLHVAQDPAWRAAQRSRRYAIPPGAPFVHLCFAHQLDGVLDRFFRADRSGLTLLEIDPRGLDIRIETAPDGNGDFPHLYAEIPLGAVRSSGPVPAR